MPTTNANACSSSPSARRPRILVIDDNSEFCQLMKELLEPEQFEVVTFTNPLKALEQVCAEQEHFDLVILDYYLPHLEGAQIVARLREADSTVKVLICSGMDDSTLRQAVAQYHLQGFVRKPFHLDDMLVLIKRTVAGAS